jgi:hypothetical protein
VIGAGHGAGGRDRTDDLLFTRQLRYHCATPAGRAASLMGHGRAERVLKEVAEDVTVGDHD